METQAGEKNKKKISTGAKSDKIAKHYVCFRCGCTGKNTKSKHLIKDCLRKGNPTPEELKRYKEKFEKLRKNSTSSAQHWYSTAMATSVAPPNASQTADESEDACLSIIESDLAKFEVATPENNDESSLIAKNVPEAENNDSVVAELTLPDIFRPDYHASPAFTDVQYVLPGVSFSDFITDSHPNNVSASKIAPRESGVTHFRANPFDKPHDGKNWAAPFLLRNTSTRSWLIQRILAESNLQFQTTLDLQSLHTLELLHLTETKKN